ncbi:MAG: HIT family protein [Campylobacterales bacterium]|nr:HIT family protein [Campylobacterales bacterium]
MTDILYKSKHFYLKLKKSHIPWVILYADEPYKELSDLPKEVQFEMLELMDIIEKEMIAFYKPTKINVASFGNYLPRVHVHIMARFEHDGYYPEPMWGQQQEEINLSLPPIEEFIKILVQKLKDTPKESITYVPVKKSMT